MCRPSPAGIGRLLLALAGVVTVLGTGGAGLPWPRALAEWLALAAGFCFALTNVLLRRLTGRRPLDQQKSPDGRPESAQLADPAAEWSLARTAPQDQGHGPARNS